MSDAGGHVAGTESSGISAGFSIVVAMDSKRGIGKDGGLPWPKLKGDMKFFRELTTCPDRAAVEKRWGLKPEESSEVQKWEDVSARMKLGVHPLTDPIDGKQNIVAMGRKTWDSLPVTMRPLPHRQNIVLSRGGLDQSIREEWANSLPSFLFASKSLLDSVFVIGGGQIYSQAVNRPECGRLFVTEIDAVFDCDTFFPDTPGFHAVLSSPWIIEGGIRYRFRRYDRTV
jgi:dihydrofolate reductase